MSFLDLLNNVFGSSGSSGSGNSSSSNHPNLAEQARQQSWDLINSSNSVNPNPILGQTPADTTGSQTHINDMWDLINAIKQPTVNLFDTIFKGK